MAAIRPSWRARHIAASKSGRGARSSRRSSHRLLAMSCSVLRCEQQGTDVIALSDLGIGDTGIRHDALLCAEHYYRLTDGERCSRIDEDRVLVVGDDLDSGGHVVAVGWAVKKAFGRTEVSIEVETPSGREAVPIKLLVSTQDGDKWLQFLQTLDTDTPLFGSAGLA